MMNEIVTLALLVLLWLVVFRSLYSPVEQTEFIRETSNRLPGLILVLIAATVGILVFFPLIAAVYTVFFAK